jgi:hypothetical protein
MNKNKLLPWIASVLLSVLLLMLCGVTIAVLDELARVPFYFTLPLLALVVNASAALWIWQRKGKARLREPIIKRATAIFRKVSPPTLLSRIRGASRASHQAAQAPAHVNLPFLVDIAEALGMVHSVAWALSPQSSLAPQRDAQKGRHS